MNAGSLLWIAEAVDIDELTVKMTFDAAVAAGDYRRACGAIRKIITWDMIYAFV
jgi:protocatechuate 3,4-dioxygenase alpha subunit